MPGPASYINSCADAAACVPCVSSLLVLLDQVCTLTGQELKSVAAAQLGAWMRQQQDLEVLPTGLEVVQVRGACVNQIYGVRTLCTPCMLLGIVRAREPSTAPGPVLQLHAFLQGLLDRGCHQHCVFP
jgi:hypothetical protein